MRRWLPACSLMLSLLAGLLVAGPAEAAQQVLSGTIDGSDGRAVNALLGFDVFDKARRRVDLNGAAGYSLVLTVNPGIPADGAPKTPQTTTTWSVRLPSSAAYLYIEAYPKSPHPTNPNRQAATDQRRYGQAMRRALPARGSAIQLRLPVICDRGGSTGGIKGKVTRRGRLIQADRVRAWSTASDSSANRRILGWNMGSSRSADKLYGGAFNYVIGNLASGQGYVVWVTVGSVTKKLKVARVDRCRGAVLHFGF